MATATQQTTSTKQRINRGGRPALAEEERRCMRIQPSFTYAEFAAVEEKAEALGVDVSEWLRIASLGETVKTVPAINRIAYAELARLAANLNQLAAKANSNAGLNTDDVTTTTSAAHAIVQKLRAELLGKGVLQ